MTSVEVDVVEHLEDLARQRPAWLELAAATLEPNVFFEADYHLAALRHFDPGRVATLLVWRRTPGGRELVGLFPVARRPRTKGLPLASFGTWRHPHVFLGTPLLHAAHSEGALRALLAWGRGPNRPGRVLCLDRIPADGPFPGLLDRILEGFGGRARADALWERPLHRPRLPPEEHLRTVLRPIRRRRLRRWLRQLAEEGSVAFHETGGPQGLDAVCDAYLRLEADGWKGGAGTALALSPADAGFFREVLRAFGERGRLLVLSLSLNGVPIAMRSALLSGDGSFCFKTSFDPRYAHYSPGVLLEVEQVQRLAARPDIAWMDSCASSEGSPLHWLWSERRKMQSVLAPLGDPLGDLFLRALPVLKRLAARGMGGATPAPRNDGSEGGPAGGG